MKIIRPQQLDTTLVKSYATDFCGVKSLQEASRAQVENFVTHLSDWVEKDRNALLCQLNSYLGIRRKMVPHESPHPRLAPLIPGEGFFDRVDAGVVKTSNATSLFARRA